MRQLCWQKRFNKLKIMLTQNFKVMKVG